jgi:4-amino-4-deoxy-L-arabinose transferase-like glycosyltransferase
LRRFDALWYESAMGIRRAALAAILLYAAFLRLYRITTIPPGLYPDEAMNGNNAVQALETHRFEVFYPENNGREGLYINIAAVSVRLFGNRAWALRVPAALFGILTVWGVYALGAELFGVPTGLLAAFFIATSFWHVNFSRIGFRSITAPFFLVWALYFLIRGVRCSQRDGAWLPWTVAAGMAYGLGFYSYIAYRATPLLLIPLLVHWYRQHRRKEVVLFSAIAAGITLPLAAYFAEHPGSLFGHAIDVSVLQAYNPVREAMLNAWRTMRMFFTRGDNNWRHNVAWRAELYWPVALLFAAGVAIAIVRLRNSAERLPYALALGWCGVAAIPLVFSFPAPHALRAILMAPAVFLLAGVAAVELWKVLRRVIPVRLLAVSAAVALGALAYEANHTYFQLWAPRPEVAAAFYSEATEMAQAINALPKSVPKFVLLDSRSEMAAQPVMFLTSSYTAKDRRHANIRYFRRSEQGLSEDAPCTAFQARFPGQAAFCIEPASGL